MSLRYAPAVEAEERADAAREAAERDAADLLYRHGAGSVLVSLLASSGLAWISIGRLEGRLLAGWWLAMSVALMARGVDMRGYWERREGERSGVDEIRRFGLGLTATAILWAVFPVAFLWQLDPAGQAYTTMVLCGMVGGSATVLSPSKTLSLIYCVLLVVPASLVFLFLGGRADTFLGILGLMFFVVMLRSSRVTHRAAMSAIELSRTNEALLARMEVAQRALHEWNQMLEERIQARTADLKKEVGEKEHYAKQLALLASTDSLTGLRNRGALAEQLSGALREAEARNEGLALLFIDLDRFKEVNDLQGHLTGDVVLREVSRRLAESLRAPMEVARWGGDEFVVVLPGVRNAEEAVRLARRLREALVAGIAVHGSEVRIDATIGIAQFPEHGRSAEELIQAADGAMYACKEERRRKIKLFNPQLGRRLRERRALEAALREAVHGEAMSLVFQPIVRATDGLCETLEALARWRDAERGWIPPGKFIPLAERTGEIVAMGQWVLVTACREASTWQGQRPPSVSVNVSAAQIELGTLERDVAQALRESGLAAERLRLELTESVFAGDRRQIVPALSSLRKQGIKIALDDFGTGFSCLADLRRLPIDQIKIDKSFVEAIETDAGPIVDIILATARTFGLEVVAEGVETEEQARRLRELGAHYLQGFWIAQSLEAEATRAWLQANGGGWAFSAAFGGRD